MKSTQSSAAIPPPRIYGQIANVRCFHCRVLCCSCSGAVFVVITPRRIGVNYVVFFVRKLHTFFSFAYFVGIVLIFSMQVGQKSTPAAIRVAHISHIGRSQVITFSISTFTKAYRALCNFFICDFGGCAMYRLLPIGASHNCVAGLILQ